MYEVQVQPGLETETPSKAEENIFYATSVNEANNQALKQTFFDHGAIFVLIGVENYVYLMGVMCPENETPQAFTFVPSCFEEVPLEESKNATTELTRAKRGLFENVKKSEKIEKIRQRMKNSTMLQNLKNMLGLMSSLVPSFLQ